MGKSLLWMDVDFLLNNTGVYPLKVRNQHLIQKITLDLMPECLWQFQTSDYKWTYVFFGGLKLIQQIRKICLLHIHSPRFHAWSREFLRRFCLRFIVHLNVFFFPFPVVKDARASSSERCARNSRTLAARTRTASSTSVSGTGASSAATASVSTWACGARRCRRSASATGSGRPRATATAWARLRPFPATPRLRCRSGRSWRLSTAPITTTSSVIQPWVLFFFSPSFLITFQRFKNMYRSITF